MNLVKCSNVYKISYIKIQYTRCSGVILKGYINTIHIRTGLHMYTVTINGLVSLLVSGSVLKWPSHLQVELMLRGGWKLKTAVPPLLLRTAASSLSLTAVRVP